MSIEAVEEVIGRAVVNPMFRRELFDNPDAVLAGFELTVSEADALKRLDKAKLETLWESLGQGIKMK